LSDALSVVIDPLNDAVFLFEVEKLLHAGGVIHSLPAYCCVRPFWYLARTDVMNTGSLPPG
jgi:hypothetical protein